MSEHCCIVFCCCLCLNISFLQGGRAFVWSVIFVLAGFLVSHHFEFQLLLFLYMFISCIPVCVLIIVEMNIDNKISLLLASFNVSFIQMNKGLLI